MTLPCLIPTPTDSSVHPRREHTRYPNATRFILVFHVTVASIYRRLRGLSGYSSFAPFAPVYHPWCISLWQTPLMIPSLQFCSHFPLPLWCPSSAMTLEPQALSSLPGADNTVAGIRYRPPVELCSPNLCHGQHVVGRKAGRARVRQSKLVRIRVQLVLSLALRARLNQPSNGPWVWGKYIAKESVRLSLSHRSCTTYNDSSWALSRAQRLFHKCLHNHLNCRNSAPYPLGSAPLPARLIDCSDPVRPRIVQTSPGEKGNYIALSYVWGGPQPHSTCRANLTSYMHGIGSVGLPQTIRDAIHVTHALGFRFLWVDSLCIVQDWPEDLQRELGRMRHIYRHALLTIDAASAETVHDGFLHYWQAPLAQPDVHSKIPNLGTRSRAWCLQETLVSCRSLVFTTSTVYLDCRTAVQNAGSTDPSDIEDARLRERPFLPDIVMNPFSHPKERSKVYHEWRRMLSHYTDRVVSHSSDKLMACAGLAEDFARLLGSDYLAGLWRDFLIYDLLWQVNYSSPGHITPCRPLPYRAPSWSWASVDGRVSWRWNHLSMVRATAPQALAEIVECKVTTQDQSLPFGQVTNGSLSLRVPLFSCERDSGGHIYIVLDQTESPAKGEPAHASSSIRSILPGSGSPTPARMLQIQAHADCQEDAATRSVWAIPLVHIPGESCTEGLLVTRVGLDDEEGAFNMRRSVYRRVAYFTYTPMNSGDEAWYCWGSPQPSVEIQLV
ncbi:heterokaryon incompatibility protein-domain-containing protein [Cubamyces menziesii]|nr:heterokaryon incompatibility protein-domain-containing protein [Cubamyces menziesii]